MNGRALGGRLLFLMLGVGLALALVENPSVPEPLKQPRAGYPSSGF